MYIYDLFIVLFMLWYSLKSVSMIIIARSILFSLAIIIFFNKLKTHLCNFSNLLVIWVVILIFSYFLIPWSKEKSIHDQYVEKYITDGGK